MPPRLAIWKLGAVPQPCSPRGCPIGSDRRSSSSPTRALVHRRRSGEPSGTHVPPAQAGELERRSIDDTLLPDRTRPHGRPRPRGGDRAAEADPFFDPGAGRRRRPAGQGWRRDGSPGRPGPLYRDAPFSLFDPRLIHGGRLVVLPGSMRRRRSRRGSAGRTGSCWYDNDAAHPGLPNDVEGSTSASPVARRWSGAGRPCPLWLKEGWIDGSGGEQIYSLYAGTGGQAVRVIRGDEWMKRRGSVGPCLTAR